LHAAHAVSIQQRVAFQILLNTGQRSTDAREMVRQHYRNGEISVMQHKIKKRMWISASRDLREVLDPWVATMPDG
jgi:integrase